MVKRTGPTNENLMKLINDLTSVGGKEKISLWKITARYLGKPTRKRIKVNLFKINKITRDGETALVPGKVLASGDLTKKINVAGFQFSDAAKEKIKKTGKVITIQELLKENPKGKKIRLVC